jgi:diguanylate cyclase (GGDEF)-like protein
LRRLATALAAAVGPDDEVARVGGDEFAILTHAGVAEAGQLSAQLRAELAAEDIHITFGWGAFPEDGISPIDLFRKADDRLYAAKLIQRNHRVVEQLTRTAVSPPAPN